MTTRRLLPTLARVNELLSYDPLTGIFRWKLDRGRSAKAGQIAGARQSKGYVSIQIDGRRFLAHRVAWLIVYGVWPPCQLDHRNRIRDANWIDNLRLATGVENARNRGVMSNSSSGVPGVYLIKKSGRWVAQIRRNGKSSHIGSFFTIEEATLARQDAERLLFGSFQPTKS